MSREKIDFYFEQREKLDFRRGNWVNIYSTVSSVDIIKCSYCESKGAPHVSLGAHISESVFPSELTYFSQMSFLLENY